MKSTIILFVISYFVLFLIYLVFFYIIGLKKKRILSSLQVEFLKVRFGFRNKELNPKIIGLIITFIDPLIISLTGSIVTLPKWNYVYELLLSLLGNFIGTFLVGKVMLLTRQSSIALRASAMAQTKLNDGLLSIFILSVFCGMLMYIAVNNYKNSKNEIGKYVGIFMCVTVFILCGFEHCVANMFYFSVASAWTWKTLLYTLIMVLGNSVGSIIIAYFYNLYYKN